MNYENGLFFMGILLEGYKLCYCNKVVFCNSGLNRKYVYCCFVCRFCGIWVRVEKVVFILRFKEIVIDF